MMSVQGLSAELAAPRWKEWTVNPVGLMPAKSRA